MNQGHDIIKALLEKVWGRHGNLTIAKVRDPRSFVLTQGLGLNGLIQRAAHLVAHLVSSCD